MTLGWPSPLLVAFSLLMVWDSIEVRLLSMKVCSCPSLCPSVGGGTHHCWLWVLFDP